MTRRIELAVLDMAGTTVHDRGLVLECFVAAAQQVGLVATPEELNARMGHGKLEVFDELATRQLGVGDAAGALRDEGYAKFRAILEDAYAHHGAQPVEGAEATIAALRARGLKVALNTGFYRRVTDILVDALGWREKVDAIVCVDDVPRGRPAPYMIHTAMQRCDVWDVRSVVVAGDTPSDVQAGRASGATIVAAVTSGAHTAATLRREPLTHLLDGVWQLPELIRRVERLPPDRSARPRP